MIIAVLILFWRTANDLEFIQCACRFTENCSVCDNGGGGSKRQEVKTLIRRLKRDDLQIEENIFRSVHLVDPGTSRGSERTACSIPIRRDTTNRTV